MFNKSLIKFESGNYDYAEKLILGYIKNNIKDSKAFELLARIYRKKKLYIKSIQNYKKSLAIKKI